MKIIIRINEVIKGALKAPRVFGAILGVTILSAVISGAAMAETAETQTVRLLDSPREISVSGLRDQNRQSFDFQQLRGKVVLVMFGFTNCEDVCPMMMQRLKNLESFAASHFENIAYVMVSVDSQRDTSELMKRYLMGYSSRFIGVHGEDDAIRAAAVQFSAAYFKGISSTGDKNYEISHSPQIFVLDPTGQVRAELYDASVETMYSVSLALAKETDEMSAGLLTSIGAAAVISQSSAPSQ